MVDQTPPAPGSSEQFTIADWTVRPGINQLQRGDEIVTLQSKAMNVLLVLASNPGEVVSKNFLLDSVWDQRFVVEGVLKRCISDIRKALGDDSASPQYIETIPRHGYRLIATVEQSVPMAPSAGNTSEAPYLGLDTFGFSEANLFFGRDQAITDICHALQRKVTSDAAFVLVFGMSGVGKSSLVRAGVVPKLLRNDSDRRATFRHSDTPGDLFDGMAACLLRSSALPILYRPDFGQQELAMMLRKQPQDALELILHALSEDNSEGRLLLVIDQLEELFSFSRVDAAERIAFFAWIKQLAHSGRVWVIATMRSDYYHRCSEIPDLLELKSGSGQYDLLPPTAAEIRQIIQRPAEVAGLVFETDPITKQSLAEVIGDAAILHPEALPLLEFTLHELFKRRESNNQMTIAAYQQLGGVEGCLGQRAEEIFRSLPPATKTALPQVLESLVAASTEDESLFSAQPALRQFVATNEQSENLVDAMIEARLFTTHLTHDGEDRVVRIAHEALITYWDRARLWLSENARFIRLHQRISVNAQRWIREGRRKDLLLPEGWQLKEAETVFNSKLSLSDSEMEFLQTSHKKVNQARQLKSAVLAILAIFGVTAIGAMYFAEQNRQVAAAEKARAESEAQVAERTIQLLSDMFELSDPGTRRSETITPKELLDEGAERVEKEFAQQPLIQATLLQTIGKVYRKRSHYDEARTSLELSLEKRINNLGAEHPLVADTESNLADVFHDLGEYEAARKHSENALAIRQKYYGESHALVAQSLLQIGWCMHPTGDVERAEQFATRALEMQTAILDPNHIDIATSHKALGLFLRARGAQEEAEPHLLKALEIRRKQLGPDHPEVGMSLNHLAGLYTKMSNYDKARVYSEEALTLNTQLLGEDHPDVALSLYNLAGVLFRLKEYEEAEKYARASVNVNVKALGDDHANVAITKGFLAYVLLEQGKFDEALALTETATNVLILAVPPTHWRLAWLASIKGAALAGLGHPREAEQILIDAYQIIGDAKGFDDEATIRVRGYIERLYSASADQQDYQRVSAILRDLKAGTQ